MSGLFGARAAPPPAAGGFNFGPVPAGTLTFQQPQPQPQSQPVFSSLFRPAPTGEEPILKPLLDAAGDKSLEEVRLQQYIGRSFNPPGQTSLFNMPTIKPGLGTILSKCMYSCDVAFLVGSECKEVRAHRAVLAAASEVFKTMFFSGKMMERSRDEPIRLPDLDPAAVQSFVDYCYMQELPMLSSALSASGNVLGIKEAFDVLQVADKYRVIQLKEDLTDILMQRIDPMNAVLAFALAFEYQVSKDLEDFALTMVVTQPAVMTQKGALDDLSLEAVMCVLRKAEGLLNSPVVIMRAVDYMKKNEGKLLSEVQTFIKELGRKCGLGKLSAEAIRFFMEHGLADREEMFAEMMKEHDNLVAKDFFKPQPKPGPLIYRIFTDEETKRPAVKNVEEYKPSPDKKYRLWVVKIMDPMYLAALRANYEYFLLNCFCLDHNIIHYIQGTVMPYQLQNATITDLMDFSAVLYEEEIDGTPVFDYLHKKNGFCHKLR